MIPKTLNYCWFGGKKKPKLVRDCIVSWKKNMPEYNIIEWNEKNSDLFHPFVKEAYRLKKWAFVADYVRLNVIYENGGIYLDTDMMVLKSFDAFLDSSCFFGAEDSDFISCGIMGAKQKNEFIKKCLRVYDSLIITMNTNLGEITIPRIITKEFNRYSKTIMQFDKIIFYDGIVIYPSSFFYPFPFANKSDLINYKNYIKYESYAVHLWSSSWIEYSEFYYFRNSEYSRGFAKVFDKIIKDRKIDLKYLGKIASAVKESFSLKQ